MPRSNSVRAKVRKRVGAMRGKLSELAAFHRAAMPFIRNEKGFRYELDDDRDSPTYNQARRVPR